MCTLNFALDGFAEDGSLAAKEKKVLMLGVVEHLDGISFENVFELVVLENIIRFSALFVNQSEAVHRVYLNSLGNVHSLLDNVFPYLF